MKEKYEKWIEFSPAFDKRHKDPKKNYGIHCVTVKFILRGKKGAVQFELFSGWFLPEIAIENKNMGVNLWESYPMATDLGFHSYVPRYKEQSMITEKCPILHDKPCYYDGFELFSGWFLPEIAIENKSGLNARPIMERLLREGHEAVWEELEEYYRHIFKGEEK